MGVLDAGDDWVGVGRQTLAGTRRGGGSENKGAERQKPRGESGGQKMEAALESVGGPSPQGESNGTSTEGAVIRWEGGGSQGEDQPALSASGL